MPSGRNLTRDLTHDIGEFIRDLRRTARISLRELAARAGVSNPYLSQIERGLRKPSAEVLAQIASALRVSTPLMYLRAGLLQERDGPGVLTAIAADPDLTMPQKQTLTQIYDTFRRENARTDSISPDSSTAHQIEPEPTTSHQKGSHNDDNSQQSADSHQDANTDEDASPGVRRGRRGGAGVPAAASASGRDGRAAPKPPRPRRRAAG